MHRDHEFRVTCTWTGNRGTGTSSYRAYGRDHEIAAEGKPAIAGSAARVFHGDASRYNPEELLVAALSACHMLTFLHLCADAGIAVTAYRDDAWGYLEMNPDGSGQFTQVVLRPRTELAQPDREPELQALHERAHELCFIARSVKFPVACNPAS